MSRPETVAPGAALAAKLTASAVTTRPDGGAEEAGYLVVDEDRLFTVVHHPPGPPRGGVVVVSPLMAEGVTNYRREVVLARALAAAGFVTARFHHRGVGRSAGTAADVTFERLVRDAAAMADHVTARGAGPVALVGTRVGATIAAAAAPSRPVVAWAPVLDHRRYIREIVRSLYLHALKENVPAPSEDLADRIVRDGFLDVFGYPVHRTLHDTLLDVDPKQVLRASGGDLLLVEISMAGHASRTTERLVHELRGDVRRVAVQVVEGQEAWWFSTSGGRQRPVSPTQGLVEVSRDWILSHVEGQDVD